MRCKLIFGLPLIYTVPLFRVSLKRIGYNATEEEVSAVCITRTSVYACCLLRDISNQCKDISLDDGSIFFI